MARTDARVRSELAQLGAYCHSRMDLIQASGGNASVKTVAGEMWIKASGYRFEDLAAGRGTVRVDCGEIVEKARVGKVKGGGTPAFARILREWCSGCEAREQEDRPSMELSFHGLLGPVVLHTHPVAVNAFLCAQGGRMVVESVLRGKIDHAFVPYGMPGLEVGVLLWEKLAELESQARSLPPVLLLENHGVIVHGPVAEEVIGVHERLLALSHERLAEMGRKEIPQKIEADRAEHGAARRRIASAVPSRPFVLSAPSPAEGENLAQDEEEAPRCLFPDAAVFLGPRAVALSGELIEDAAVVDRSAARFLAKWGMPPRLWETEDTLFAAGSNRSEAEDALQVGWAHMLVQNLARCVGEPSYLPEWRVREILSSEQEKHRQNVSQKRSG